MEHLLAYGGILVLITSKIERLIWNSFFTKNLQKEAEPEHFLKNFVLSKYYLPPPFSFAGNGDVTKTGNGVIIADRILIETVSLSSSDKRCNPGTINDLHFEQPSCWKAYMLNSLNVEQSPLWTDPILNSHHVE